MNGNFFGGVTQGAMAVWKQMRDDEDAAINNRIKQRQLDQLDKQDALNGQMAQIQAQQSAADEAARLVESYGGTEKNIDAALSAAKQNGQTLTPEQEDGIRKAWTVKSDPVRRYEFEVQRANAHAASGDWKTANAIKKEAESDAAGEWINGVLNGDRKKVLDLYNLYPNGHNIARVDFDGKGNMIVSEKDGRQRAIPQYDAIAAAMSLTDPKVAATMAMNKFKTEEQMDRLRESIAQRDRAMLQRFDEAVLKLSASGRGAGSSAGTGGGKGSSMPPEVADVYGHYGYKDPTDFTADIRKRVAADSPNAGMGGVDIQSLATKTQSNTAALMAGQLGHGYNVEELYPIAYKMAQAELGVKPVGPDGKPLPDDPKTAMAYKPYPELAVDGKWYPRVRDTAGNEYRLGNRPVDPISMGLTPEKVADIEISVPANAELFKKALDDAARGDRSSLDQITKVLGSAKADALMKAYERTSNPPEPAKAAPAKKNPGSSTGAAFSSDELAQAAEFGVKPRASFSDYVDRAKQWGAGLVDSASRNAFANYLTKFRGTKRLEQGDALYLFDALQTNPSWRSQLSPSELTTIQVAAGKKFN